MVVTAEEGKTWSSSAIVALSWLKKRVPLLTASVTCSRRARYRGDAGEIHGRCRGDAGEMQGRYKGDTVGARAPARGT